MALRIDDLERWVARKKQETRDAEPLSIQANISVLSARLWVAEQHLAEIRRFVDAFDDDVPTEYLRRILDGGGGDV